MKWKYQQLTACHHFSANLFKLQKIGEVVTEGLQNEFFYFIIFSFCKPGGELPLTLLWAFTKTPEE